ncbi:MAG TPA: histidine phosphatase family protein [Anaerolineaceae bacterium]|nr:histidine phosphatase family protein [Anaerolineaceae bacterium]
MKTLLVMRHAKSSWKDQEIPDHDRPLKKRGRKDIVNMAKILKKKGLVPDHIISSTAVRAKDTASLMIEKLNYKGKIELVEEFYMAEPEAYIEHIAKVPKNVDTLLIIGHNPGLEGLVMTLGDKINSLPTGSIAKLYLFIDKWSELTSDTDGEINHVWVPEEFR